MATNNLYTTKTAALKATKADINKIDAKKMLLNGKNILDYISDSEFDSYDTRDPQLKNDELDIWNTAISLSEEGHIEVKPHVHGVNYEQGYIYEGITENQHNILKSAVKVIDNEVLGAVDAHLMYWQTDGLTHGVDMFNGCSQLESFSSDLSSLTGGYNMFASCSNLTSFNSDLPSLTKAYQMFSNCKLDAPSVANIIHFIPQRDAKPTSTSSEGNIDIGLGITNTDAAKQAFAEECYCDNWEELNKEFDDKNWAVQWQFNGSASYSLRDPRPSTAVYAKLEEVFMPTEEEIAEAKEKGERIETPHYEYTSQDGSKFYNIHWYHDSNTNNEGYDYFESLEEAISAYGVIHK